MGKMPWLELLVPFLVVLAATSSVTMAAVFVRAWGVSWGRALLGFLTASAGVAFLTAAGIFLKASGLVGTALLYEVIWTLSFVMLAVASWLAVRTALLATGSRPALLLTLGFWTATAACYLLILVFTWKARADLYFPYIGGTYAATSLYLAAGLSFALLLVWRRRTRLDGENWAVLRRFLRIFLPLGAVFLFDELARLFITVPWVPLLQLAPLALYGFVSTEIAIRVHRPPAPTEPKQAEETAGAIAARCQASPLTRREREVLVEMLLGRDNAGIARQLSLSVSTVKNHVYNLFQKVGVGSRGELSLLADQLRQPS